MKPPSTNPAIAVMVIEDNDDVRGAFVDLLVQHGFSVAAAINGIQALRMLEDGAAPDVLLLDLELPFMSGWQLCRELQRDPRLRRTPIVIVTAHEVGHSSLPDVYAVLLKPLDPASLISVLKGAAAAVGSGS